MPPRDGWWILVPAAKTPGLPSARALGRKDSVGARASEGIVECNADQGGEKGVAHVARRAGEPGDGMVGGWARGELAVADG